MAFKINTLIHNSKSPKLLFLWNVVLKNLPYLKQEYSTEKQTETRLKKKIEHHCKEGHTGTITETISLQDHRNTSLQVIYLIVAVETKQHFYLNYRIGGAHTVYTLHMFSPSLFFHLRYPVGTYF